MRSTLAKSRAYTCTCVEVSAGLFTLQLILQKLGKLKSRKLLSFWYTVFNFDTLARAIAPKKTKSVKAAKVKKVM